MVFRDLRAVQIYKIDSYGHQHYRPFSSILQQFVAWMGGREVLGVHHECALLLG